MTLEPCPMCGSKAYFSADLDYRTGQPTGKPGSTECANLECCLVVSDMDGSAWNRLSLDARLGQMVREYGLTIIDGPAQGTFRWRTPGSNDLSGAFTSKDDVIRDAWRTLREGK